MNRKWNLGEPAICHIAGTGWLAGVIVEVTTAGPKIKITQSHPVWTGAVLRRGDYTKVRSIIKEYPDANTSAEVSQ